VGTRRDRDWIPCPCWSFLGEAWFCLQTSWGGPDKFLLLHLLLVLLTCPTYTLPHSHAMQYIPVTFRHKLPFTGLSIGMWIVLCCIWREACSFFWRQLDYMVSSQLFGSFCFWDLCFGARAHMTLWFLYPLCLKAFFRWLIFTSSLSSLHTVLAHWMTAEIICIYVWSKFLNHLWLKTWEKFVLTMLFCIVLKN
jgi:hypothetical protein